MTPRFAQAVDPIYLHVLDLLDRIAREEQVSPQEERLRIRSLIDQGEAIVGAGQDWELAKYALVSWIDEVLVDAPWPGRDWWGNNVLEIEFFNTRACYDQFYVKAQEASTLTRRDALETYYVCAVLGFRGVYRDPTNNSLTIQSLGLPVDLATWAHQASMSIRLGQGRPPLASPRREISGAPPLKTRPLVVWAWLAAVVLITANAIYLTVKWTSS